MSDFNTNKEIVSSGPYRRRSKSSDRFFVSLVWIDISLFIIFILFLVFKIISNEPLFSPDSLPDRVMDIISDWLRKL
ncbi:hypothetical protein ACKP2L_06805 [Oenococcus alcoholitolerans]|uniref:Motility protein B-like N-terminal domain-containing protein n=1 Tax=Oenococcus alcoholitolerans TaxID=931074 RepID=A0ABR4XQL4_9LACO|nr:hypothetical protein Q757_05200 [Oenococcus alcoholitolerans]